MINILHNYYTIDENWCFSTFEKYIKEDSKVVIIAFSFRDKKCCCNEQWNDLYGKDAGKYYNGIVNSFLMYGIKETDIKWINYYNDTIESAREKIQQSDILYLPGGLPDKMYNRLLEFDLIEVINQHKGVVMGFSAGAMIQLNEYFISPDKDYPEFSYYKGCGLISDFGIEVHYEGTDIQNSCIQRFISEKNKPVYAIADKGAVIVDNGVITTVGDVTYYK